MTHTNDNDAIVARVAEREAEMDDAFEDGDVCEHCGCELDPYDDGVCGCDVEETNEDLGSI